MGTSSEVLNGEYLTTEELVARWKNTIKPETLANWRAAKKGPTYVKLGGRILYVLPCVIAWEQSNLKNGGQAS